MRAIYRKRLRALGEFVAVGVVVGALVGELIHQMDGGAVGPHLVRGVAVGILVGCLLGVGEELLFVGIGRGLSYVALNVSRVLLYSAGIIASLIGVNSAYRWLSEGTTLAEGARLYDTMGRDLIFAVVVAVLGTSFLEVRRLHNPGDLRRFLMGRYRRPEEEERVFLFVDMEDSTAIAERLGSLTYSNLLRDCFYDISEAILAWRGQVYQYVGDEVIVTWPFEEGVNQARCVRCFFDMLELLEAKRDRNEARYGVAPRFRAGIHGGTVVTTWIGEAKKELAFHGDTLNVAARMEGACRELGSRCLVSANVFERIAVPEHLRATPRGELQLRGKQEVVEVWSIERRVP
ncbi:MAG: adenylate/guanylate cyclase domain-containing protein [Gemmatimonadetes bacterium]|nr:adenylate/guanylate cyclase domain-containing protein [Gemmatimonadota bacterium]